MARLYQAVQQHDYSETTCFLCGRFMEDTSSTVEHVLPKWVLREFNLWDQKLSLLNGTSLRYRNLVIPCCKDCNSGTLAGLEARIQQAYQAGPRGFAALEPFDLLRWALKIQYGMLYREVFLPFERTNADLGTIVSTETMERYNFIHFFLQSLRVPMHYSSPDSEIPGTVWTFSVKVPRENTARFDFRDDIESSSLYLRMGAVAVLAAFDGGAQALAGRDFYERYTHHTLHPIQVEELAANFFMHARLMNRPPKFIVAEEEERVRVVGLPIGGFSSNPVFDDWDTDAYVSILSTFTRVPENDLRPTPEQVMTFLEDGSGEFKDIDIGLLMWG